MGKLDQTWMIRQCVEAEVRILGVEYSISQGSAIGESMQTHLPGTEAEKGPGMDAKESLSGLPLTQKPGCGSRCPMCFGETF